MPINHYGVGIARTTTIKNTHSFQPQAKFPEFHVDCLLTIVNVSISLILLAEILLWPCVLFSFEKGHSRTFVSFIITLRLQNATSLGKQIPDFIMVNMGEKSRLGFSITSLHYQYPVSLWYHFVSKHGFPTIQVLFRFMYCVHSQWGSIFPHDILNVIPYLRFVY